jgi:hypothetical protein
MLTREPIPGQAVEGVELRTIWSPVFPVPGVMRAPRPSACKFIWLQFVRKQRHEHPLSGAGFVQSPPAAPSVAKISIRCQAALPWREWRPLRPPFAQPSCASAVPDSIPPQMPPRNAPSGRKFPPGSRAHPPMRHFPDRGCRRSAFPRRHRSLAAAPTVSAHIRPRFRLCPAFSGTLRFSGPF